ncbi:MoaE-domain-containing protein [Viridothelium virens]|uniref:Molybdopterin synthase catalytic subunit n=1 Tax=Viridothelium virens TaxID=1048519 RepID=A0A6A6HBE5_VIRVR|nr:MoaE-domain-containing protein [Viridothelium virens]
MVWQENGLHVELTYDHLNINASMDKVRSSKAGAIVIFAGTTRDNFDGKSVKHLEYSSYIPMAISTLSRIARSVSSKHGLTGISITHRLGTVPIGEESILIAVSAPHRQAGWRAGEEALEETKEKAEIWKLEEFGGEDGAIWRANKEGSIGVPAPR